MRPRVEVSGATGSTLTHLEGGLSRVSYPADELATVDPQFLRVSLNAAQLFQGLRVGMPGQERHQKLTWLDPAPFGERVSSDHISKLSTRTDYDIGVETEALLDGVLDALHQIRDQLTSTIDRLDHDGEATLAERTAKFADNKQTLDERVSGLLEQFSKLDGINSDIRGLFGKLRGEVDAVK